MSNFSGNMLRLWGRMDSHSPFPLNDINHLFFIFSPRLHIHFSAAKKTARSTLGEQLSGFPSFPGIVYVQCQSRVTLTD